MLESFKIVVLCLICTILISFITAWLFRGVLLLLLIVVFYDFDTNTPLERHAINKSQHAYLKVRKLYEIIYKFIQNQNRYEYATNSQIMNKQPSEFDLSRFSRSGSVYSPISKLNGSTSVTRRLQPTHTSTPLTRTSPWQRNSITPVKATSYINSTTSRSPRYCDFQFFRNASMY